MYTPGVGMRVHTGCVFQQQHVIIFIMKHRVFNISLFVIYITGMTGLMIWQGIGIDPSRYAFIFLPAALIVKRTRSFLLDWIPFLFILLSYDFLRGFADNLNQRVHVLELINWEKTLFEQIPTITLQNLFYSPSGTSWLDYFATMFYFLHFALPLSFGFLLWMINRSYFKYFVTGILLLSYAGWITFLIYPAAPPWMAAEQGYLSGVHKILDVTLLTFPDKWNLPSVYHNFNPNPVAAMPSLHAGYPLLILLFAIRFFKLKALLFAPFVLGVWVSLVYLGEHYVVDIIGGAIYAVIFYFVSTHIMHRIDWDKITRKVFQTAHDRI